MMKDFSQLTLQTDEGEKTFDVLFNFHSEEFNKNYMVICPSEADSENGQVSVTPLSYTIDEEGNVTGVNEIETREEFEHVKTAFEEELYQYHHEHDHDHGCGCGGHHHHDHDHDHGCGCGGHGHGGGCGCGHHHDDEE